MSVLERITVDRPPRYEVRWRDIDTGRHRSRTFATRVNAELFDRAVHAWQAKRRADAAWETIPHTLRELVIGALGDDDDNSPEARQARGLEPIRPARNARRRHTGA